MDVLYRAVVAAVLGVSAGLPAGAGEIASAHPWEYLGAETAFVETIAVSPTDGRVAARIEEGMGYSLVRKWITPGLGQDWSVVGGFMYPSVGGLVFDTDGVAVFGDLGGLLMATPDGSWPEDFPDFQGPVMRLASLSGDSLLAAIGEWAQDDPPLRIARLELASKSFTDLSPSTLPANHKTVWFLEVSPGSERVALVTDQWPGNALTPHMWVSHNAGQDWIAQPLSSWPASDMRALTFVGDVLVAVFEGDWGTPGLLTSADFGGSWQASQGEFVRPMQLAADPSRPGRVWLAAENGLFLSEDSGETWTLEHSLDDPMIVSALAVHQPDGRPIISTWRYGTRVFDPADGQLHAVGARLGAVNARDVAVNPLDSDDVSALAYSSPAVFQTSDGGESWARDPGFWGNSARSVMYTMQGRLLAAGHRSTGALLARDPGQPWTTLLPLPAGATNFTMDDVAASADGSVLMASSRMRIAGDPLARVMVSGDGGQTWGLSLQIHEPAAHTRLVPRRFDADRPVILADLPSVGQAARLFVHDPATGVWEPGGQNLPPELEYVQVCMADGELQLGTAWVAGRIGSTLRVFRSRDHGRSFSPVTSMSNPLIAEALWCHPDNPDIAVVSGLLGPATLLDARDGSTQPFGQMIQEFGAVVNSFDADTEGNLYAATRIGVWKTTLPEVHEFRPHELVTTTHGARMRPQVTVTWDGGAAEVLVERDGTVVHVGPNTGQFSERLAPGQALPAYRVCNVGYEWVCTH